MFIPNGDGTYTGGLLDVILIYHNVGEDTFHPAVYIEAPMPGPIQDAGDLSIVRLRSQMHHTTGLPSLKAAQENIRTELQPQLGVEDGNIVFDPPFPWDGRVGDVMVMSNWRRRGAEVPFRDMVMESIG
jgi:hypothetical protein